MKEFMRNYCNEYFGRIYDVDPERGYLPKYVDESFVRYRDLPDTTDEDTSAVAE